MNTFKGETETHEKDNKKEDSIKNASKKEDIWRFSKNTRKTVSMKRS